MTMTNRDETISPSKSLSRVFAYSGGILALFALNLFVLEPLFHRSIGPRAAQLVYIVIRIVGIVVLAFLLTKNAKRNRFQTLSTVLLVGFIDQVVLKGIWIKQDMVIHPGDWTGIAPTSSAIFVNMAVGYLFFTPLILILAFFGMESTRFRKDWKLPD